MIMPCAVCRVMIDRLPRDLQLEVIKSAGIDARIALGLVGRLRVPQHVVDAITAIRRPMEFTNVSRVVLGIGTYYELKYRQGISRSAAVPVPDCWQVCAYKQHGVFHNLRSMHDSTEGTRWRGETFV